MKANMAIPIPIDFHLIFLISISHMYFKMHIMDGYRKTCIKYMTM